eukprot:g8461.t1
MIPRPSPKFPRLRFLTKLQAWKPGGHPEPTPSFLTNLFISLSAFCCFIHPPNVLAIDIDRELLEQILTREIENRMHRASDTELQRLLRELASHQGVDLFLSDKDSPTRLQMNSVAPTREPDFKTISKVEPPKEEEEQEEEEQEFLTELENTMGFNLDLMRFQRSLRYALAGGIAITVFIFGLQFILNKEQDLDIKEQDTEIEEQDQNENSQEMNFFGFFQKFWKSDKVDEEEITEPEEEEEEEELDPLVERPVLQEESSGVLWRRSGDQKTDLIETPSFLVEWKDPEEPSSADQLPKKDIESSLDTIKDSLKDQEQEVENTEVREMTSPADQPTSDWKASEILSNVDSNHSAVLLPNILRLTKRD